MFLTLLSLAWSLDENFLLHHQLPTSVKWGGWISNPAPSSGRCENGQNPHCDNKMGRMPGPQDLIASSPYRWQNLGSKVRQLSQGQGRGNNKGVRTPRQDLPGRSPSISQPEDTGGLERIPDSPSRKRLSGSTPQGL